MPKPKDPTPAPNYPGPRVQDPVPVANRLLLIAARITWTGVKLIVKTAIRIPRLFVRLNTRPETHDQPTPHNRPAPPKR